MRITKKWLREARTRMLVNVEMINTLTNSELINYASNVLSKDMSGWSRDSIVLLLTQHFINIAIPDYVTE